jgi:hypothetical protein
MKKCPFCAEEIPDNAVVCSHCNRSVGSTGAPAGTAAVRRGAKPVARVFWVLSLIASLVGGFIGVAGVAAANGAPQEAAAAAMGCLIVIAPYAFARGIDALTR